MCGIAGFYNNTSNFEKPELVQLTNALTHRGPDASGYFLDNKVGLGHRRLSVIDLSEHANQPMESQCGRYVICYNGEVYNFKVLAHIHRLNLKTNSDTEVILELFTKLGIDFINELNGMFAFTIYDKQTQNLLIFRDRLGIKPLYYYKDETTFIFASELKAIAKLSQIKSKLTLNNLAIQRFLHLGYIPQPLSIYNEIQKFPSGNYGVLSNNKLETVEYYIPTKKLAYTTLSDEQQAKKQLNHLLNKSIEQRLVSDVPFGTFLSGGIDSSAVTAIAQKQNNTAINTFSIGFKDKKHNEAEYAREISKHLGTKHHELFVTEQDGLDLVEEILNSYDEPYADSSAIPTMLVSKMAKQQVTMTLSGDGGDELFHGYGAYKWAKKLSNKRVFAGRKATALALNTIPNNRFRRASLVYKGLTKQNFHSHIFSQEQYLFSENETNNLLKTSNIKILNYSFNSNKRKLTSAEKQAIFDLNYYLKDDLLVKVDRASMKYSLETRVPLLDHNIVEFALNLDPKLKIKNGNTKYLLKQVLYDYVPKKYFDRPKQGFSIPLSKWLKTDLKYLIDKYLSKQAIEATNILNYSEVKNLKILYLKKNRDYLYNRIWLLIILQMFLLKE